MQDIEFTHGKPAADYWRENERRRCVGGDYPLGKSQISNEGANCCVESRCRYAVGMRVSRCTHTYHFARDALDCYTVRSKDQKEKQREAKEDQLHSKNERRNEDSMLGDTRTVCATRLRFQFLSRSSNVLCKLRFHQESQSIRQALVRFI